MKLNDLRPAPGAHTKRTRVGRGIAAGKGKTAGRGTKGQRSRAGSSIPPFFEGGQTPLSQRIPKLHGFKNRFKIHYEVVNVGRISAYAELGRFGQGEQDADAAVVVNPELLRAAGLIGTLRNPVKVLGQGDVSRKLYVLADAFTKSAAGKLQAAGGTAQVIELPDEAGAATAPEPEAPAEAPAAPKRQRPAARATAEKAQAAGTATSGSPEPEAEAPAPEPPAGETE